MKEIPPALAEALTGPATTLATCWRLTRRDGTVLGFTDHDRVLAFDGTTFRPELGFEASATTLEPDFASGSSEATGILSSGRIAEADLSAGLWDGARVEIFLVNWQDTDARMLLRRAIVGEVSRAGNAFRAELRGLAHLLDQPQGRVFSHLCDADLGDTRCALDLAGGGFRLSGTVAAADGADRLRVAGIAGPDADWFAGGTLEMLDGPLAGTRGEVVSDRVEDGVRRIGLIAPLPGVPQAGAGVRLSAGCDKRFATCREKFGNGANFQGFPHMPGADRALAYPERGAAENDGGTLVR